MGFYGFGRLFHAKVTILITVSCKSLHVDNFPAQVSALLLLFRAKVAMLMPLSRRSQHFDDFFQKSSNRGNFFA